MSYLIAGTPNILEVNTETLKLNFLSLSVPSCLQDEAILQCSCPNISLGVLHRHASSVYSVLCVCLLFLALHSRCLQKIQSQKRTAAGVPTGSRKKERYCAVVCVTSHHLCSCPRLASLLGDLLQL